METLKGPKWNPEWKKGELFHGTQKSFTTDANPKVARRQVALNQSFLFQQSMSRACSSKQPGCSDRKKTKKNIKKKQHPSRGWFSPLPFGPTRRTPMTPLSCGSKYHVDPCGKMGVSRLHRNCNGLWVCYHRMNRMQQKSSAKSLVILVASSKGFGSLLV